MGGPEQVRIEVIIDVGEPAEVEAFDTWARQVGLDVEGLVNTGCGCCVDIYTLDTSALLAGQLETRLSVTYLSVE